MVGHQAKGMNPVTVSFYPLLDKEKKSAAISF
jgi:hypothetical protein